MQARMKITPPHLAFLEWGDFHTCSCFARSTIPEGKLRATCSLLSMQIASWIQRRCAFLLHSEITCDQAIFFFFGQGGKNPPAKKKKKKIA